MQQATEMPPPPPEEGSPARRSFRLQRSKAKGGGVVVLLLLILGGLVNSVMSAPKQAAPTTVVAQNRARQDAALAALVDYNAASADVWADYVNPSVSADDWVSTVDVQLPEMDRSYDEFLARVASFQDPEEARTMQELATILSKELGLTRDMRDAVVAGEASVQKEIGRQVSDLLRERARLAKDFMNA